MDRITSNQVSELMEAYASVYAPQELTEEQVWEEVEGWVNSLLEEGYDLSEYTWEDMYEEYLNEINLYRPASSSGSVTMYGPNDPRRTQSGPYQSRFSTSAPPTAFRTRSGTQSAPVANMGTGYRGAELQAGARARASQVGTTRQGSAGTGAALSAAVRPAAPARPTVPAAKPAAPAAARPTAPAPKAAPAAPAASSIERRIPTSAELKQAQQLRTTGANLTGTGALAPKPAAAPAAPAATSTPAPAAAPKPNLQQSIRNRRLNMDLDLFDVIKGHLLDEGYADSEEAALKIMANMSEEWREEILEGSYEDRIAANNKKYNRNRQRAAQRAAARNAARDAGKTGAVPGVGYVTPRRESETYIDSSGTERHKSGAKMPKKEN